MTEKEAAALVSIAAAAIPTLQGKGLGATARAWAAIMPDVSFSQGKAALIKLLREREIATMPLPGEILATIRELQPQKDAPPGAIEAWDEVRRRLNPYASTEWSHPLIKQAINLTGVQSIIHGDWQVEQRFMRIYNTLLKRDIEREENPLILAIAGAKVTPQLAEKA